MAVSVSDPNPQCPYALKLSCPHSQSSPAQDEDRSAPPGGTDRIFTLWGSQPSIFRETDIQKRRKITGKQSYIDGCNSRHKSICPPWAESHSGYGLPKAKYILSCGKCSHPPSPQSTQTCTVQLPHSTEEKLFCQLTQWEEPATHKTGEGIICQNQLKGGVYTHLEKTQPQTLTRVSLQNAKVSPYLRTQKSNSRNHFWGQGA